MTPGVRALSIPDVKLITPRRFGDARGYFVESWNRSALKAEGIDIDFCQDNQSLSATPGTLRGMHFQTPPHAQTKLVSVLKGRIFDVVVDLRKASPTYGRHLGVELDAEGGAQLLVPKGFAHGFCTLVPDTLIAYKVDAHYAATADAGIFWGDETLAIDWPVTPTVISPRDAALPRFKDFESPF